MIFTSFEFIAFFLIVLIGYYLIFPNLRWIWLLAASFYFYTKASPQFLPYILASVAVIYASSRMIGYVDSRKASYFQKNELTKDEKKAYNKRCTRNKKIFCATGIILNVGMLAFTKYFNFVGESVSAITGGTFTALDIIVPLGISFYTFQSTGYLIDVYRGMYEPQKNPMKYALFILFFPQIMQGPIGRYNDLAPQLFEPCKFDYDRLKSGLVRMLWGFFKKMVIADRAAFLVNTVFDNWKPYSGAVIWVAVFLYAVQLYADFSGYMDIALGAGEALGIRLSENFRTPYFSKSTAEFWRRWHITLGRWFREYVYIPLGGNRKGKARTFFNLFVVWSLTALWHGANYNFLIWGGILLCCLLVEKLFLLRLLDKSRVIGHLYVLFVVPLSWVAFAVTDLSELGVYMTRLFPFAGHAAGVINHLDYLKYLNDYAPLFLLGVLFATPLPETCYRLIERKWIGRVVLLGIFGLCMYYLAVSANNPFLYFNF